MTDEPVPDEPVPDEPVTGEPTPPSRQLAVPTPAGPVRRRFGELPVAAVTVVLLAGLVAVTMNHWRKGMYAVGVAALLGALLRLVLPTRDAGLLAVRTRLLDVLTLGAFGAGVVVLAYVVPAASA